MDKVLRADKKDGVSFTYAIRERSPMRETLVTLTIEAPDGVFRTLFEDLSEGV
jgi:hypothetical protein